MPAPVVVVQEPIYLHVLTRHAENWNFYCDRYRACNGPVYFVQDRWYSEVDDRGHRKYKPRDKDKDHGRGRGKGKDDD